MNERPVEMIIARLLFHYYEDIKGWKGLTYTERTILGSPEEYERVVAWIARHEGDSNA